MAANPQPALSGLARALIQHGRVPETDAVACSGSTAQMGGFIVELHQRHLLSYRDVATFAAITFGHPLFDLNALDVSIVPRDAVDRKLMTKHQVLPLAKRANRLIVALADPTNLRALDEIRFQTGMPVDPVVVELDKLTKLVDGISESTEKTLKDLTGSDFDINLLEGEASAESSEESGDQEVDDAPVVRFIQKILLDAINEGASDVHFEPYEKFYRIRIRTDGVLREVSQPPLILREKIAARIKVISRLDISEKRVPQDGRMKLALSKNKSIDFRVSTLPTLHGEKIVMRILDPSSAMLGVDALGYDPDQKAALLAAVERPYGMVLVTGPTGSGKTVSLYTCLNLLNKPGVNISTAEDPDVIMVGEIRDLETAEIAVKAAQTGHMVMSTLHTNDAPSTLERLRNMGVAPFNIASSVIMITAQRLARRLCTCKKPMDIPIEALLEAGFSEEDLDGSWQPYGPGSCERCKGTGYKGRVGIYQVMPISDEIAHIIMTNGNSLDIAAQAQREGVRDLRQSGLIKVRQGLTSLAEVLAYTNE